MSAAAAAAAAPAAAGVFTRAVQVVVCSFGRRTLVLVETVLQAGRFLALGTETGPLFVFCCSVLDPAVRVIDSHTYNDSVIQVNSEEALMEQRIPLSMCVLMFSSEARRKA